MLSTKNASLSQASMCGIQPGEELEYCNNPKSNAPVVDENGKLSRAGLLAQLWLSLPLAANTLLLTALFSSMANG